MTSKDFYDAKRPNNGGALVFVFSVEIRASGNPMCMTLCNEEGSFGVLRVVKGSLPTSFTQVKTHILTENLGRTRK